MTSSLWRKLLAPALLAVLAACLLSAIWLLPTDVQAHPAGEPARLLALARDLAANREVLAAVDQATGELSPLGAGLDGCCTTNVLDAALDAAGGRYYAVMARDGESSPRVLAFDTQTGAAAYSPPLTDTPAINYLAYDPPSGQLLALSFVTDTLAAQVVRLDPITGGATTLNTLPNCCNPQSFDAVYDPAARRLYAAVTFYAGTADTHLLTISGADGSLLAEPPLSGSLAVNHMAYDSSSDTLWAVVYDAAADAERLARIDPLTGALTPLGDGIAACCARLVTDAGVDGAAGVLVAPMIDTRGPNAEHSAAFFRYRLADGSLLGSPPVDPRFQLHYVAFDAPLAAEPTGTATPTLTATGTPTVTPTSTVTPTPTITPTPLPPRLYLPAVEGSPHQGS